MTVNAIIQARIGSTRLPGKVLMDLHGKPVLEHVILRLQQSAMIDRIIVATSMSPENDGLAQAVEGWGIPVFRGNETDVLDRYYEAAKMFPAEVFVRITADCPLIDPRITDLVIEAYLSGKGRYVTNAGGDQHLRTFPRGLDTEVFSWELLAEAHELATEEYEREHVTPYMYWKQDRVFYLKNPVNLSHHRWTLDTWEDYRFIEEIYKRFYHGDHDFYMDDVVGYLTENPDLRAINNEIKQKAVV